MRRGILILAILLVGPCLVVSLSVAFLAIGQRGAEARLLTAAATPTPTAPPPSAAEAAPLLAPNMREVLRAEEAWLEELYSQAGGKVVNITSRSYSYDFFMNVVPQEGSGSGFLWDTEGHIVTNYHVIQGAQELEVRLADGRQATATIVGSDPPNDLAVLRLNEPLENLPAPLGISEGTSLRVGQRVVAIGNPFGFERTLTTGVVSALGRVIQSESGDFIGEVIQHDAAINPGNSGGPLLDLDGRVIGVNTQIFSPSGANAGIGFAIPAETIRRVVPELIAQGRYPHPWLGVESVDVTAGLAQRLARGGLPLSAESGILVVGVYQGGPAENTLRGGNQRVRLGNFILPLGGDLIVALDDQPINNQREMLLYLEGAKRVGDSVRVRLWRDGTEQEVTLTLGERPERR